MSQEQRIKEYQERIAKDFIDIKHCRQEIAEIRYELRIKTCYKCKDDLTVPIALVSDHHGWYCPICGDYFYLHDE